MSEAFKKVGRGGAGNFYSKKDVEDVKGKGKAAVCPFFFIPIEAFQFSIPTVFYFKAELCSSFLLIVPLEPRTIFPSLIPYIHILKQTT
jgi:hypothetical protein